MSTLTIDTARWALGGYADPRSYPHCKYCGRIGVGRSDNCDCPVVACLLCGARQCHGNGGTNGTCSICYNGWLPGWSRRGGGAIPCGYVKCELPAVADAPRVGCVCSGHADRAKLRIGSRSLTLREYATEQVALLNAGKLAIGRQFWRWVA